MTSVTPPSTTRHHPKMVGTKLDGLWPHRRLLRHRGGACGRRAPIFSSLEPQSRQGRDSSDAFGPCVSTQDPTDHRAAAAGLPPIDSIDHTTLNLQATLHKMQHGFFDPTRDGGNKSVPVQAAIEYGGFWGPFLQ